MALASVHHGRWKRILVLCLLATSASIFRLFHEADFPLSGLSQRRLAVLGHATLARRRSVKGSLRLLPRPLVLPPLPRYGNHWLHLDSVLHSSDLVAFLSPLVFALVYGLTDPCLFLFFPVLVSE
jgi:hypothetical protein